MYFGYSLKNEETQQINFRKFFISSFFTARLLSELVCSRNNNNNLQQKRFETEQKNNL